MKPMKETIEAMVTPGTPECAVFCGVIGLVLALLILTFGFWKTLLIALFCAVGAFIGGVKDKSAFLKKVLNRVVPDPNKKTDEEE